MGALRGVALALALCLSAPARADDVARWRPIIAEASARFGVHESWITRVMRAESAGRTTLNGRPIVSPAGAMGLMQLMPATWAAMRARLGLGGDPHDPRDNILAGTLYLRLMYDRFGYPGLFGAYNAGPGRYAGYLAGRQALPGETRAYLETVTGSVARPPAATLTAATAATARPNGVFFSIRGGLTPAEAPSHPAGLFIALSVDRHDGD